MHPGPFISCCHPVLQRLEPATRQPERTSHNSLATLNSKQHWTSQELVPVTQPQQAEHALTLTNCVRLVAHCTHCSAGNMYTLLTSFQCTLPFHAVSCTLVESGAKLQWQYVDNHTL